MRDMNRIRILLALLVAAAWNLVCVSAKAADPWVVYEGGDGPGKGKHIVFVSGDEEYRSEEALPQLGKILAKHHGFKCTVLFAIDPKDGTINPNETDNIPGLEALQDGRPDGHRHALPQPARRADEVHRRLRRIGQADHRHAHRHARLQPQEQDVRANTRWNSKEQWTGGFGRQVLGETWVSHHGQPRHGRARAASSPRAQEDNPILRGIKDGDIWGPTDVYGVRLPLPGDCKPLVLGQVLKGMKPTDKPVEGKKNDPMMPVAWIKTLHGGSGKTGRVFTTTMGASHGPGERRHCAGCWSTPPTGPSAWKTRSRPNRTWTSSANTSRVRSASTATRRASSRPIFRGNEG